MARRKDFSLERESIAEAGLELFRSGGLEAVSTRRVAAELGASPMSLYLHVRNKQGLLDAVVERLMREVKIDLDSEADWTAQAEQWARGLRQALSAHPEMMVLLRGRRWAIVHCTEPLIQALAQAGFDEGEAVRAVRLLTWSTLGFLSIQTGLDVEGELEARTQAGERPARDRIADSLTRLHALEGGPAPATSPRAVDRRDVDALFALQTRLLIEGLAREHGSQTAARDR